VVRQLMSNSRSFFWHWPGQHVGLLQEWTQRSQPLSLFNELKRRKVFRVAIAYVIGAWVFVQVADLVADNFNAPDRVMQMIIALLVVGLPVSLILAWVFDLTPEGIIRTQNDGTNLSGLSNTLTSSLIGGMFAVVAVVLYLIWPVTSPPSPTAFDNSIAVLPFANDSAAEENAEFFAAGMHDELLTRLADITELKVISRTSVMEYRNTTKNMRQIGKELGVVYLLEGRVQRAGNRLHIIIQLIDAASDEHLWQDTYDRELTAENIFALQAEMATSIATQLHQTLSPEMTAKLSEQPTQNTRAYEFYLSGEVYLKRRQAEVAISQFERAIEEDPMFAVAWAALSRAHSRAYWGGFTGIDGQHLEKARDAAATAFELVPNLPEAHFAVGYFYMYVTREREKSLAELAMAARDMPGSSEVQQTIAEVQRRVGDVEASIATTARAIELDPRNTRLLLQQATSYAHIHDGAQFHRYLDRVLEIEPDSNAVPGLRLRYGLRLGDDLAELRAGAIAAEWRIESFGRWARDHWLLGAFERDYDAVIRFLDELPDDADGSSGRAFGYARANQLAGQPDLAEPYWETVKEYSEQLVADQNRPTGKSRALNLLAAATAGLGDFDEARRLADVSMAMKFPDEPMVTKLLLFFAAMNVFIPAGDHDRAIELLDEHFATPVGWTIEGLSRDPRLDPIRDHPGWLALVEKYSRQ
jgi:TolB-like protein/Flp pilus assembly protein TadD